MNEDLSKNEAYNATMLILTILYNATRYFLLYGLFLFATQVFNWFYSGVWVKYPLISLFVKIKNDGINIFGITNQDQNILIPSFWYVKSPSWLAEPQSWIGLHKIVMFLLVNISLPFTIILTSSIILFFFHRPFD